MDIRFSQMQPVQGKSGSAISVDGSSNPNARRRRFFGNSSFAYLALVIVPLIAFACIIMAGKAFPPPVGIAASANRTTAAPIVFSLSILLGQVAVVIATARIFGILMRCIGQPQVIGEMISGLVLGPSLLGWAWPAGYECLFPGGVARLNSLSQIGLVLFMFLVGLELDLKHVRARFRQILVVSHAGMALPILGAGILAPFLYHDYVPAGKTFIEFALFFACAMSVTAFPVLVRILAERGLTASNLGITSIACASMADVTAWGILAVVVALERGAGNVSVIFWHIVVGAAAYIGVMFLAVRPALAFLWRRAAARDGVLNSNEFSLIILVILISSLYTEWLDIHGIFGAFVAGVIMPRDERLQSAIRTRFEDILVLLLLPLFFAFTGLRTNIGLLTTPQDWWFMGLIIVVAVTGKLGGSAVAARATGVGWRESTALGVLMNSRGLMELVLLTIGLQDGVITPALFTMMVIMAVVTTMMTAPLLALVVPKTALAPAK
jgi:Kef-type K+ transport system membrane component KefB